MSSKFPIEPAVQSSNRRCTTNSSEAGAVQKHHLDGFKSYYTTLLEQQTTEPVADSQIKPLSVQKTDEEWKIGR